MTTRGERLSNYIREQTGGRRGWQAALVEASGVKRQTITKWTSPTYDGYPQLEHLAAVAAALNVRLSEMVAVLEGEAQASETPLTAEQVRAIVRDEMASATREAVRQTPRTPHGRSDAA